MDITAVLDLVSKGISVATALISAAQDAAPALQAISKVVSGAQAGTVTQADLDATESVLDGMISDFNLDLPA